MSKESALIIALQADVKKFQDQMRRQTRQFTKFEKRSKSFATNMSRNLTMAFGIGGGAVAIQAGVSKIAALEFQLDKVQAKSRATDEEMKALTKTALDLGAKSKFTAMEIAVMEEEYAKMGFAPKLIIETADATRKLAQVADSELGEAAKSMAGALNSYNLQGKESGRVANVMAEAFSMSALDLEKFTVATANSGAIARVFNHTIEANTARMSKLVDANIDASKAGTDLRKIYFELNKHGLTYDEAMQKINTSVDKGGTAQKLFGDRAAGAAVILAEQQKAVKELEAEFSDMNRELDNQVAIMEDNLLTDWQVFLSAINNAILKGGALNPVLRNTVQYLTDAAVAVQNLDLLVGVLFKSFQGLSDKEVVRLVEAGMVTEQGNRVKEIIKPLKDLPKDEIAANWDKISTDIVNSLVKQGESIEDAQKLINAYKNTMFEASVANIPLIKLPDPVEVAALKQELEEIKNIKVDFGAANQEITLDDLLSVNDKENDKFLDGNAMVDDFFNAELLNEAAEQYHADLQAGFDRSLEIVDTYKEQLASAAEEAEAYESTFFQLGEEIGNALANSITRIASSIGAGDQIDKVMGAMLGSIGSSLQQMGSALIAGGISLKAALKPDPAAWIAAGAIAVATGTAVKRYASQIGGAVSGGGSVGAARAGGSSSGSGSRGSRTFTHDGQSHQYTGGGSLGGDGVSILGDLRQDVSELFTDSFDIRVNPILTKELAMFDDMFEVEGMQFGISKFMTLQKEMINLDQVIGWDSLDLKFSQLGRFTPEQVNLKDFLGFTPFDMKFSGVSRFEPEILDMSEFVNIKEFELRFLDIAQFAQQELDLNSIFNFKPITLPPIGIGGLGGILYDGFNSGNFGGGNVNITVDVVGQLRGADIFLSGQRGGEQVARFG